MMKEMQNEMEAMRKVVKDERKRSEEELKKSEKETQKALKDERKKSEEELQKAINGERKKSEEEKEEIRRTMNAENAKLAAESRRLELELDGVRETANDATTWISIGVCLPAPFLSSFLYSPYSPVSQRR